MADLDAAHLVAQDVVEICHCCKYVKVGSDDNPDHYDTICFVEKPLAPGAHYQPIIFVSWDVTPEHGQWSLTKGGTELNLRFNARFGQKGFENRPLWSVRLLRHSDAKPGFEWQGHDRKGARIVLEHLESAKRGPAGWWESSDTL